MNGNKTHPPTKRKRPSLPPHTWEAHPNYKTAEINKTFIVAIVSVVAVVILALLLFVGSQFVGKAYSIGGNSIDAVLEADGTLTITATLASGVETGSAYLELTSPNNNFNLCGGEITNYLWEDFDEIECSGNKLLFSDATLNDDDFLDGTFIIAELNPTITQITSTTLTMGVVDVYDASTGRDLFPGGGTFPITVPTCASGTSRACGNNVGLCQAGTQTCTAGVWGTCTGIVGSSTEICDAQDNDCDASTDEGGICNTNTNCGTFRNACAAGQVCTLGVCVGPVAGCTPALEICDQLDNNCNGQVDENNVCTTITMSITSDAFDSGGAIPPEYTCDAVSGTEVSPPLRISNIPAGTQSLALIMDDPTFNPSQPAVHWMIYNIPRPSQGNIITIPQRGSVAGAVVGRNQITQQNTYSGPCPPEGESHQYRFRVYALDTTIPTPTPLTIQDSSNIIRGNLFENYFETPGDNRNILQQATLTGIYYPPPAPSVEVPRGGGGFSCSSQWSCPSPWNYCNATLQQSRTCTDTNRCDTRKLTKLENRSCTACEESWVCSPWSNCQNAQQSRSCTDEHSCRTIAQKPVLQKSCAVVETGPAPVRVQPSLPLPDIQQPAVPVPSFWDKYKWFITGIPAALLVIVLIIFGAVHIFKPKPAAYNAEELKEWIKKEQQMGTSNDDIKSILAQHTGWNKEEMEGSFAQLKDSAG